MKCHERFSLFSFFIYLFIERTHISSIKLLGATVGLMLNVNEQNFLHFRLFMIIVVYVRATRDNVDTWHNNNNFVKIDAEHVILGKYGAMRVLFFCV